MITTELRSAVQLAGAAEHLDPNARAPAAGARRASGAPLPAPLLSGKPPLRLSVPARSAAQSSRKASASRSRASGYAAGKSSSRSAKPAANDPLAFLKDRGLTIEEKLIKLLGYLNGKWEKEMQDKLRKIAAAEEGKVKATASSSSGSSGSKKGGGVLGSLGGIADVIHSVVAPASAALKMPIVRDVLKQVGVPVVAAGAAALGSPALAPLVLKYGPQVVDAAAKLTAEAERATSGSSAGGSSGGGSKAVSDSERQMLMMEIQRLQQKQQEMFGLVSNVLKSNHDVRMALVGNIR